MTGLIIVFVTQHFYLQIVLISQINMFMAAWALTYLPMDSRTANLLFCFNEFFLVFSCDMLLIFTDFVGSHISRYYLGYLYLSGFYLSIFFNLGCMVDSYVKRLKRWKELKKEKEVKQMDYYMRRIAYQD